MWTNYAPSDNQFSNDKHRKIHTYQCIKHKTCSWKIQFVNWFIEVFRFYKVPWNCLLVRSIFPFICISHSSATGRLPITEFLNCYAFSFPVSSFPSTSTCIFLLKFKFGFVSRFLILFLLYSFTLLHHT